MKKVQTLSQRSESIGGNVKSNSKEKSLKKRSKMHKRIFSKSKAGTSDASGGKKTIKSEESLPKAGKSDTASENFKQAITNVKHVKDNVSSNWAAFKASGLHKIQSKPKQKPSSNFEGIFRKKWKTLKSGNHHVKSPEETAKTPKTAEECINLEDSYTKNLVPSDDRSLKELTRCIAIDCEMVGVGDGKESALARVSLVNQHGTCVYDKFVKCKEEVTDYRTKISGVRPGDLALGEDLETVQKDVANIVHGRILVGHAIIHDLKVLFLSHPQHMIRDTSKFKPFRDMFDGRTPALRKLSEKILGVKIQESEHSSVQDAKATMQLYNLYQKEWEEHRKAVGLIKREKLYKMKDAKRRNQSLEDSADFGDDSLKVAEPDLKLNKHRKLHLRMKDSFGSQKSVVPSSTMPDEYVAF